MEPNLSVSAVHLGLGNNTSMDRVWWQDLLVGHASGEQPWDYMAQMCLATLSFAYAFSALLATWIKILVPVGVRISSSIWALIWHQPLWRHSMIALAAAVGYATMRVCRKVQKNQHVLKNLMKHGSFFVAGPVLWYLVSLVPPRQLQCCLWHASSTVPTIVSLGVLACSVKHRTMVEQTLPSVAHVELQKLCLSYWACWPLVTLFGSMVVSIPGVVPHDEAEQLSVRLQRAFLICVAWMQLWQGSCILQRNLWLLAQKVQTSIGVPKFIRSSSVLEVRHCLEQAKSIVPTVQSLDAQCHRLLKDPVSVASQTMQSLRQLILWTICTATVGSAFLASFLLMCFYVWWLVKAAISMSMWCFFAGSTANILLKNQEDRYIPRLAFWVMVHLWSALQLLPVVGFWLTLATPCVVLTMYVAGETVLTCAVLPLMTLVVTLMTHGPKSVVLHFRKLRKD